MISTNAGLILAVIRRFGDVLEVTEGETELEAIARVLSAQVPSEGITGMLSLSRATEEACEALARRLRRGELDDRREYLRFVFRSIVHGEERPRRAHVVPADEASGGTSGRSGAWSYESRGHARRTKAIAAWRDNPKDVLCPHWALNGFNSPEEYEESKIRARRGLPGLPERERPFSDGGDK
jgi:hypothetical protein